MSVIQLEEQFYLDISKFTMKRRISTTHKSIFCKILENDTHKIYVAKIFNSDMDKYSKYIKKNLPRALQIMSTLNHFSFLRFKGFSPVDFENKPKLVLVNEFCSNEKLSILLSNVRNNIYEINSTQKLIIIFGIASGMKYLHSKNIVHRKLQTDTIYLDNLFYPKILNYYYKEVTEKTDANKPFEIYIEASNAAPEVLMRKEYSKASDVYAFAMIVYEIIANEKPFKTNDTTKIMNDVVNKKIRPKISNSIPECYRNLINSCWSDDPSKRPTFSAIVEKLRHDSNLSDKIDHNKFNQYVNLVENDLDNQPAAEMHDTNDENMEPNVSSNINLDDYILEPKKIGTGAFADVYKITEKKTSEVMVAKIYSHELNSFSEKLNFKREIEIHAQLNLPSILKFIGFSRYDFNGKLKPTIVTEYVSNGSLKTILEMERLSISPFGWDDTLRMINIYGIASGMAYLHSLDIIHRDLKPENILEDQFLHPKICDFGLSKKIGDVFKSIGEMKGTPMYMAPEIFNDVNFYSKKADVYSFSMILYEIFSGKQPFENRNMMHLIRDVTSGVRPELTIDIPKFYQGLIKSCWSQDPNDRPSFDEIVLQLQSEDAILECADYNVFLDYIDHIDGRFQPSNPKTFRIIDVDINILKEVKKLLISPSIQEIDLKQFTVIEKLGEGGFAEVSKVQKGKSEEYYAAKELKKLIIELSDGEIINFSREVNIFSKIDYPAIIKFIGYSRTNFEEEEQPVLISELAVNGSLRDILDLEMKGCAIRDWDDTKKFINIYGVACGMKLLHSHAVLHRDLKPDNILLDSHLYPKLTDFGLSRTFDPMKVSKHDSNVLGTPPYVSPEIWNCNDHSQFSDVYAFAFVVYEIMTGVFPFKGFHIYQIMNLVGVKKYRPKFTIPIPDCYRELIESCWSEEPSSRPTFDEIVHQLKTNPNFVSENVDIDELVLYSETINEIYDSIPTDKPTPQAKQIKEISIPHSKQKFSELTITQFKKVIETEKENPAFKDFCVNLNDYEQAEIIKKEELNKIYKVINKETGKQYAARISNIDMNQFTLSEMQEITHEMNIISQIKNKAILKFVGFSPSSFTNEPKPVIIHELLKTKTLYEIMKATANNKLTATKKLIIIYGIALGMKCLHSNGIIHRNLNPRNILLDKKLHPKLTDFGLCTHLLIINSMTFKSTSKFNGSPVFSAPEVLNSKECTKKSDVYSFAFVVYQIMSEIKPFSNLKSFTEVYNEVVNFGHRPEIPDEVPECYQKMIKICWSQDPEERPTFDDIVDILSEDKNFITSDVDSDAFEKYVKKFNEVKKSHKHHHKKHSH